MSHATPRTWLEANQSYLMAALGVVREALERHGPGINRVTEGDPSTDSPPDQEKLKEASEALPAPAALDMLTASFGLSHFERDLLLLCAGMELSSGFPGLCATAQGDPRRNYPTFSLAMAALTGPHWSALTPTAPLRYWHLIRIDGGGDLTNSPLYIDERVLNYLTGVQHLDQRLLGFVERVHDGDDLVPSHREVAERIAGTWLRSGRSKPLPIIQLHGDDGSSQQSIAVAACAKIRLSLHRMPAQGIPLDPREFNLLMRLWEREAVLSTSGLLLDCGELDTGDIAREQAILKWVEGVNGVLILAGCARRRARQRTMITFDVGRPTIQEQRVLWQQALGSAASRLNGTTEALVAQFNLSVTGVRTVCTEVLAGRGSDSPFSYEGDGLDKRLWDACRVLSRPRLDDLAQRIESAAPWDDLVLPEPQKQALREIAMHVRQKTRVYDSWGFAGKGLRGLGISALFAGPSGTGKTMAAEVLANELRLDPYRIDLSQVVSKYIGETEKNLKRVFDAAEGGGAILFFDEADALFGKRSEVKDSHDRYANIEVSYLLQRMEAYQGLAILTTNMKDALDRVFLRRIRFVVTFPFPDALQRAEIWRRIFPADTPTEGLNIEKLARLNVAGGSIRNIALNAAFLAADTGGPVRMKHLLSAARAEYGKMERPLTDAETAGWI